MEKEHKLHEINQLLLEENPAEHIHHHIQGIKADLRYVWFLAVLGSWVFFLAVIFVKQARLENFQYRIDADRVYFVLKQQHMVDSLTKYYKTLPSYDK